MEKLTRLQIAEKYEELSARYNARGEELQAARSERRAAEDKLKESREHFAELKERLANAEAELARLRGYLDRVHEDDVVRDGMVEIEDAQGKRKVPRRPPPMMRTAVSPQGYDAQFAVAARKRTHWTSY